VKARKAAGIVLMTSGGFSIIAHLEAVPESAASPASGPSSRPVLTFLYSEPEATAKARSEKRPLLVDFTADWCIACGKLDRNTFSDPRVKQKAGHFVAVKVDVSVNEDLPDEEQERQEEQFDAIKDKYGVVGLHTVILFDSSGKERARITDFVGPEQFLKMLDGIE
jgi:thiol:disulfide interchange protein DsbD